MISVVQDPSAACRVRGQSMGLAGQRVTLINHEMGVICQAPRRSLSEGKWTSTPFLTQAKATQASLQCGTEGLLSSTLLPQPFINTKKLHAPCYSFLTRKYAKRNEWVIEIDGDFTDSITPM